MSRDGRPSSILLTCEHGGRDVPAAYERVFRGAEPLLESHRGSDLGALGVAHRMAARLAAPIVFSTVTRLLIDLNRSLDHPEVFSELSRLLPETERSRITDRFYTPYRESVTRIISAFVDGGRSVLHIGVHSCTDVLDGERRDLDIALLFDPDRPHESSLCTRWRDELRQRAGHLRYRFNQPYLGTDDGLTTSLRTRFADDAYAGIELELRHGMIGSEAEQRAAGDLLAAALAPVI